MYFSNSKDKKLLYEINLDIKAYREISKKDKERINKVVLLLDSLGFDKDTTEAHYRAISENQDGDLLICVKKCKPRKKKTPLGYVN
jgi:predicted AAA+ superfamily ATPase